MGSLVKPSIVFCDMDGTFLASDKHVPSANMRLLDRLHEDGVSFVPCTGRPVQAVPAEVLAHPAVRYAVGANGAVIRDMQSGEDVFACGLEPRRVLSLYESIAGVRTTFDVFADGEVLSERARYEDMGAYGIDEPTLAMLRRVRQPTDLTVPQIIRHARVIEKVTCFWCDERDRDALVQAIGFVGGLSCVRGHPKDFEVQAPGTSKGSALTWLCERLEIDPRYAVAFGDESNDMSLLKAAGVGVAMANSSDEVRAVADAVTTSNDEAGVAAFFA